MIQFYGSITVLSIISILLFIFYWFIIWILTTVIHVHVANVFYQTNSDYSVIGHHHWKLIPSLVLCNLEYSGYTSSKKCSFFLTQGLEKYVMTKLFSRTFACSPEDAKSDREIAEKICLLQHFVRPEHLDIPVVYQNEAAWLVCEMSLFL